MKKLVLSALSAFAVLIVVSTPASAQGICNQRCEVNEDCGRGYRCYVNVCRAESCPASSTCTCGTASSTTPRPTNTSTPKPTTTPTVRPSASPTPKATVKPTATPKVSTVSGTLDETPKTGIESWMIAGFSLVLFAGGSLLSGADYLHQTSKVSPQELAQKRNALKKN